MPGQHQQMIANGSSQTNCLIYLDIKNDEGLDDPWQANRLAVENGLWMKLAIESQLRLHTC